MGLTSTIPISVHFHIDFGAGDILHISGVFDIADIAWA